MKLCTTCGRRWDGGRAYCPDDGTRLVDDDGPGKSERTEAVRSAGAAEPAFVQPRGAAEDELKPGDRVGEYVVERKIGIGGMGMVYGARHPVIGKRAAIKILNAKLSADQESLARFVLEAQAVNKIGHANIVDIFSFGSLDDGRSYFAMEWLQGETLGQRLARGRLASREAIVILSALCRALEAAHAAGVIHRDIKPDNVFLATGDDGWRIKLLDFGIAKLSTATASSSRTATGVAIGTPLYMAPEQARGKAISDRTDVYALGLLAYTAVCGVSLFQDEGSAIEIMAAHLSNPPISPRVHVPDLPGAFEHLILDMIAKEPLDRPPLVEVRQRLTEISGALAPVTPEGPATVRVGLGFVPGSRPPAMPSDGAATARVGPEFVPGSRSPAMPPEVPEVPVKVAEPRKASTGDSVHADDLVAPRRSRAPLVVTGIAMLAVGVALVVASRRQAASSSSASSASSAPSAPSGPPGQPASAVTGLAAASPPSPPPLSPDAAVVVAFPALSPRTAEVTSAPPVTAELVVEPEAASLAVDGRRVKLVGGHASLALPPGDHTAIATLGKRSARKQFAVTVDHLAAVSLRVPEAGPSVVPRNPPSSTDNVDAVHNPFPR